MLGEGKDPAQAGPGEGGVVRGGGAGVLPGGLPGPGLDGGGVREAEAQPVQPDGVAAGSNGRGKDLRGRGQPRILTVSVLEAR